MDGKMLARIGAITFVAVALTVTAIELTRKEDEPAGWSAGRVENSQADPLRTELTRCQRLGEAGEGLRILLDLLARAGLQAQAFLPVCLIHGVEHGTVGFARHGACSRTRPRR